MNSRDYIPNCDVLSISSFSINSKETQMIDAWNTDSDDYYIEENYIEENYIEEIQSPRATATRESFQDVDINDPLRYFLEHGEITPNEYDKWKLVRVREEPRHQSKSKQRHDYGPGYNSDSDIDSEDDATPTIEYGHGYIVYADDHREFFDLWNPTPDTTPDRRYTKVANDSAFMLTRFTQWIIPEGSNSFKHMLPKLSTSFELKLAWERFMCSSCPSYQLQNLQDFWQEHSLLIYEALQDLVEDQARVCGNRSTKVQIIASPEYHSTPFETLENTFETIGRMSRCIAEDFNTPSVVAYVEEFLVLLYREIEFNALVKEYETRISNAE